MEFLEQLHRATLLRRYKRFLADIEIGGMKTTAHCPNTGAMIGLAEPGCAIWVMPAKKPGRKLPFSWELTEVAEGSQIIYVGIHAAKANAIVGEALACNSIPELEGYDSIRHEVRYGERSRVDFLLESTYRKPAYVEVKNVHLKRHQNLAEFPDSVTARGTRHLGELEAMVAQGARAVMLYVVQRSDVVEFKLAGDIDPKYSAAFIAASNTGVESFCYSCKVSPAGIKLDRRLPIINE